MNKRFSFNTIALFTRANNSMVDFYTKVFGFATDWDGIQPNAEMRLDNMRLLLFPRIEFEKMVSRTIAYLEDINGTAILQILTGISSRYPHFISIRRPLLRVQVVVFRFIRPDK